MYRQLRGLTENLVHVMALAGFLGLLLLALMVTLDILLRFFFGTPLQGVNDISAVVMAVVIAACIPKCLMMKQNISIEVLGGVLGARANRFLSVFASLAVLLFFVLMVWEFVPFARDTTASGEKTWLLGWPVGPWWWAATVMMGAAVLAQFIVTVEDLRALITGQTPQGPGPAMDSDAVL